MLAALETQVVHATLPQAVAKAVTQKGADSNAVAQALSQATSAPPRKVGGHVFDVGRQAF